MRYARLTLCREMYLFPLYTKLGDRKQMIIQVGYTVVVPQIMFKLSQNFLAKLSSFLLGKWTNFTRKRRMQYQLIARKGALHAHN